MYVMFLGITKEVLNMKHKLKDRYVLCSIAIVESKFGNYWSKLTKIYKLSQSSSYLIWTYRCNFGSSNDPILRSFSSFNPTPASIRCCICCGTSCWSCWSSWSWSNCGGCYWCCCGGWFSGAIAVLCPIGVVQDPLLELGHSSVHAVVTGIRTSGAPAHNPDLCVPKIVLI